MKLKLNNLFWCAFIGKSIQDEATELDKNHRPDFADLEGFCEDGILATIGDQFASAELIT